MSYYGVESVAGGFVGVLGPMRLPYAEVVPVVRYVSQVMTESLDDLLSPRREVAGTHGHLHLIYESFRR